MRHSLRWFLLLSVATACTRIPRRTQPASGSHTACSLVAVSGINIAHKQFQQAVRVFAQQPGYPYSLLYVETHTGSSPNSNSCVRLVQRAENQFTYYTYQNQKVAKAAVTNSSWEQSLAALGQGHFIGVCDNYETPSSSPAQPKYRWQTNGFASAFKSGEATKVGKPSSARVPKIRVSARKNPFLSASIKW